MKDHFRLEDTQIGERFADTRDTLCYATTDNQGAMNALLDIAADIVIVAGGYNSSNTTHLVELAEQKLLTYFINSAEKILSPTEIFHYSYHTKQEMLSVNYLPAKEPVKILMTSGASCPDAVVESIIRKLAGFYNVEEKLDNFIG